MQPLVKVYFPCFKKCMWCKYSFVASYVIHTNKRKKPYIKINISHKHFYYLLQVIIEQFFPTLSSTIIIIWLINMVVMKKYNVWLLWMVYINQSTTFNMYVCVFVNTFFPIMSDGRLVKLDGFFDYKVGCPIRFDNPYYVWCGG